MGALTGDAGLGGPDLGALGWGPWLRAGFEGQALVEGAGLGPWLRCWVWGQGAG